MALEAEKTLKKTNISKNLKKSKFYHKNAKICDIKLKSYSKKSIFVSIFIIKPLRRLSSPWVWKDLNKEK